MAKEWKELLYKYRVVPVALLKHLPGVEKTELRRRKTIQDSYFKQSVMLRKDSKGEDSAGHLTSKSK